MLLDPLKCLSSWRLFLFPFAVCTVRGCAFGKAHEDFLDHPCHQPIWVLCDRCGGSTYFRKLGLFYALYVGSADLFEALVFLLPPWQGDRIKISSRTVRFRGNLDSSSLFSFLFFYFVSRVFFEGS